MSIGQKRQNTRTQVSDNVRKSGRHRWRHVLLTGLSTLFVSWLIVFCMPRIVDSVRAYNFHASDGILSINQRLKLTNRGTDIFYATSPEIDSKTQFNDNCQTQERTTAILGCFYKDRIYLYDLQNDELDGTLEVTAAHEMLHAAYQRLTILERWWVDKLIVAEYQKVKDQPQIKQLMAYYTKAEPGAEVDELHSILGTDIATLSPDLESYYGRYFNDRASVVALNETYNHVFERIRLQTEAITARLAAAEPVITALLAQYDADRIKLEADIASFNRRANARQFSSQAELDSERAALVRRIDALNARRDEINEKVTAYNADVEELNKVSVHTNKLYESMNGVDATGTLKY